MLLNNEQILEAIAAKEIEICPFTPSHVQGCSYDVTLGDWITFGGRCLQWAKHKDDDLPMQTGIFYLGHTHEFIRVSPSIQFTVHTVSTARRYGLDCCASAGWGDPGFCNRVTLELKADESFTIPYRAIVAQIAFWRVSPSTKIYSGRYGYSTLERAMARWAPEDMLPKGWKQGVLE